MARKGQALTWTPERLERMRTLLQDMPAYKVAAVMGITPRSLCGAAKRWGIPVPQRQHNPQPGHPWKRAWPKERQRMFNEAKARREA